MQSTGLEPMAQRTSGHIRFSEGWTGNISGTEVVVFVVAILLFSSSSCTSSS